MTTKTEILENDVKRKKKVIPRRRTKVITPHITESHSTKKIREQNRRIVASLKKYKSN